MERLPQLESGSLRIRPLGRGPSKSNQSDFEAYEMRSLTEADSDKNPKKKEVFYHRDFFKRSFKGKSGYDKFLSPYDGRLCDLVVQCSIKVLESKSSARWRRIGIQNGSPWMIRISNWAMSRDHGSDETVGTDIRLAIIRWIPACVALAVVVSTKQSSHGGLIVDIGVSDQPSHSSGGNSFQFW